jgi:outer membrane protein assembly factor BamB
MRTALLGLVLMTVSSPTGENVPEFENIQSKFPLHWKANIGNMSYRSNITLTQNDIIIGSNGKRFMDYHINDNTSGVYRINRKNGKEVSHFANENLGDMDVNGILLYNGKLYFGNDNEEFLCTTSDGKIIWRNAASGDIEHEPVLVKIKGKNFIVYASELGEVRAVDPDNGNLFWSYYTPDFNGWKPGDNRTIFKVKAYFSNSISFFTKPQKVDLNGDGVDDLLYLGFNRVIYAINGANGKLLWSKDKNFQDCSLEVLNDFKSPPKIITFCFRYDSELNKSIQSFEILDCAGNTVLSRELNSGYNSLGLKGLKLDNNKVLYTFSDSLVVIGKNGIINSFNHAMLYDGKDWYGNPEVSNRNSYDELLCDKTFNYKGSKNCVLILQQRDNAHYEHGFIEIFSLDNGEVLERLAIPDLSEMPPVIEDINKDGYLDLLINCRDGYLYCYNLKIKG